MVYIFNNFVLLICFSLAIDKLFCEMVLLCSYRTMANPDDHIEKQLATMPHKPGVYMIKDQFGEIIYVGKAKDLHNRLRSHFAPSNDFSKSKFIRELGRDIEVIFVNNEAEAFLLEFNLIQEHQPKLNTHWKDGKSFPVVEITTSEMFPRVRMTRDPKKKSELYLGPFPNVKSLKQSLKFGLQLFPVADCNQEIHLGDAEGWARTCMRRRTKTCLRPCEIAVDHDEYMEEVKHLIDFLEGRITDIIPRITQKMKDASAKLEFEKAAEYRDILKALQRTMQRQTVVVDVPDSFLLVTVEDENAFGFNLLKIINERVVQQTPSFVLLEDIGDESREDYVRHGVLQILGVPGILREVKRVYDATGYQSIKPSLEGLGFKVVSPQSKHKSLVLLAQQNLKNHIRRSLALGKKSRKDIQATYSARVADLQSMLNLKEPPVIIDTFDVSTLQGTNTVASCVRFVNGKPYKKGYRRFKIKTVIGQDDFASMFEAVQRRYADHENGLDKFGLPLPDLIVIDGGEIQLKKAREAMASVNLDKPVIGLAKREEEIYLPEEKTPLKFKKNRPGMHLVRAGRDEAHRFAVTYHRKRREKEGLKSILDEVYGIGEKRKQMLLKEYGTVSNIAKESSETLSDKFNIPREIASEVIFTCRRFNDALEAREKRKERFRKKSRS